MAANELVAGIAGRVVMCCSCTNKVSIPASVGFVFEDERDYLVSHGWRVVSGFIPGAQYLECGCHGDDNGKQ